MIDIMSLPGGVQAALVHRQPRSSVIRQAWQDWLRRHSINPADVPVPGALFRDPTNRRVTYTAYERDANGYVHVDGRPVVITRTVQLEAEPQPFPEVKP